ncbi:MFS transporter [Myxococcota bacterium]|nr:MFS transporter [Myxococcota bacterium]MBU1535614.1 MFS transporter [Myxococcota bacterium]
MSVTDYSKKFTSRRFWNWFPLGIAYAALYMGRYSYIPAQAELGELGLLTKAGLGFVTMVGAITYGVSFLFNGPLTDKIGGRKAMLIATMGSGLVNLLIGFMIATGKVGNFTTMLAVLYGVNMYFQSFASVAIVKVNSNWFHISERGVFGGIFGVLIASGLFLAYTVSPFLMKSFFVGSPQFYFIIPGALLLVMFISTLVFIRDTPADAGFPEFSTGTDNEFDQAEKIPVLQIVKRIITHPIVLTISFIELCTGVLRDGSIHWFGAFAKESGAPNIRLALGIGLFLSGALGSMSAGIISDKLFNSRRPPVAALLYAMMIVVLILASIAMFAIPNDYVIKAWIFFAVIIFMSFGVIGTHGMLSGAATADFGGKQATATATGIIDGFVYLGVAIQSISLGRITSISWNYWFPFLIPFAVIGFLLSYRIRNVKPKMKGGH